MNKFYEDTGLIHFVYKFMGSFPLYLPIMVDTPARVRWQPSPQSKPVAINVLLIGIILKALGLLFLLCATLMKYQSLQLVLYCGVITSIAGLSLLGGAITYLCLVHRRHRRVDTTNDPDDFQDIARGVQKSGQAVHVPRKPSQRRIVPGEFLKGEQGGDVVNKSSKKWSRSVVNLPSEPKKTQDNATANQKQQAESNSTHRDLNWCLAHSAREEQNISKPIPVKEEQGSVRVSDDVESNDQLKEVGEAVKERSNKWFDSGAKMAKEPKKIPDNTMASEKQPTGSNLTHRDMTWCLATSAREHVLKPIPEKGDRGCAKLTNDMNSNNRPKEVRANFQSDTRIKEDVSVTFVRPGGLRVINVLNQNIHSLSNNPSSASSLPPETEVDSLNDSHQVECMSEEPSSVCIQQDIADELSIDYQLDMSGDELSVVNRRRENALVGAWGGSLAPDNSDDEGDSVTNDAHVMAEEGMNTKSSHPDLSAGHQVGPKPKQILVVERGENTELHAMGPGIDTAEHGDVPWHATSMTSRSRIMSMESEEAVSPSYHNLSYDLALGRDVSWMTERQSPRIIGKPCNKCHLNICSMNHEAL